MMMKLDAKFYGEIRKAKNNSVVPDDEWMCFLAQDNAFAAILPMYLDKCVELGCDQEHIKLVEHTLELLNAWREAHPDRLKNPDAKGEMITWP